MYKIFLVITLCVFISFSSNNLNGSVIVCGQQMWIPGPLEIVDLPSKNRKILDTAQCYGAIFSPQGNRIAYIKNNKIYIINNNGTSEIELRTKIPVSAGAFLTWINKENIEYIYFSVPTADSAIYRTRIDFSDSIETVFKTRLNRIFALRVSKDGKRAAWTKNDPAWINQVMGVDFTIGNETAYGAYPDNPGCNGCISPSGNYVMHCLNSHTTANIHPFESPLAIYSQIVDSCSFSLVRFSSVNDSFVVYSAMDWSKGSFVYNIETKAKDSVGLGEAFDFWPGLLPSPPLSRPSMVISKEALSFTKNGNSQIVPSSIVVNCANKFPSTFLHGVSVAQCPSWLTLFVDSTDNNNLKITNSINTNNNLPKGTYSARIVLENADAFPTKVSYKLTYTIGNTNAPAKLDVTLSTKEIRYGDTMFVYPVIMDSSGDTLTGCNISWDLSSGETIDSIGRYVCRSTKLGPIYIIGKIGNISDTDTVVVTYVKPGYTFIKPDKNDTLKIGDTLTIQWDARDDMIDAVIEISLNNGKIWQVISGASSIKKESPYWGKFKWKIPDEIEGDSLSNKNCLIKIRQYSGSEYSKCAYKIMVKSSISPINSDKNIYQINSVKLIINSKIYIFRFYSIQCICFYNFKGVCVKKLNPMDDNTRFILAHGLYILKFENSKSISYSKILIK